MTSYELTHFKEMVWVWKTKSLLFCLRYDPLIVFRRQNHITFIFIKTMSHDLLVQMAYCLSNWGVKMGTSGAHHPKPPYTLYPWVNLCSYPFIFRTVPSFDFRRNWALFACVRTWNKKTKWRRRQREADWFTFRVNPFSYILEVQHVSRLSVWGKNKKKNVKLGVGRGVRNLVSV